MSERETLQGLIDASEKAVAARTTSLAAPPTRPRVRGFKAALGVGVLAAIVGWILSGGEVAGPTAQQLEAGRRAALTIAGGMVRDYLGRNGRYPEKLGDAMREDLGVLYRRLDDGFELTTTMPDGKALTVKDR